MVSRVMPQGSKKGKYLAIPTAGNFIIIILGRDKMIKMRVSPVCLPTLHPAITQSIISSSSSSYPPPRPLPSAYCKWIFSIFNYNCILQQDKRETLESSFFLRIIEQLIYLNRTKSIVLAIYSPQAGPTPPTSVHPPNIDSIVKWKGHCCFYSLENRIAQ